EKAVEKIQSDLEFQKHAAERAQAELDKVGKQEADRANKRGEEHDAELEELRQELAQEKIARSMAESANKKASDRDAELEELRHELEQEKQERQKLESASRKSSQQDDSELKKELEEE